MKRLFEAFYQSPRVIGAGFRAVSLLRPDHDLIKVAPTQSRPFFERAGFIIMRTVDFRMWRGFRKREVFPLPMSGHPDLAMTVIPLFFEDQVPSRRAGLQAATALPSFVSES